MVVVALARLSCSDSAVVVLSSSFPAYGPGPVLPGVAVVLTVPFSVLSFYLAFFSEVSHRHISTSAPSLSAHCLLSLFLSFLSLA